VSSFYELVGSIKGVVEAGPVFKAAWPEEVATRPGHVEELLCPHCNEPVWDRAKWNQLNKCWGCGLAFDVGVDEAQSPVFKAAGPEELDRRAGPEDRRISAILRASAQVNTNGVAVDVISGATFDDFVTKGKEDLEEGCTPFWTQICPKHAWHYKMNDMNGLDRDIGSGICGVQGCNREAVHYYDFNTRETLKAGETA